MNAKQTKQRILEAYYSQDDIKKAFDILELPYGDAAKLKAQFKKLAVKHHPDRGGSEEKMKQLNWANDVLSSGISFGKRSPDSTFDKEDFEVKLADRKKKAVFISDYVMNKVQPLVDKAQEELLKHFSVHMDREFQATSTIKSNNNSQGYGFGVDARVEWVLKFESVTGDKAVFQLELWATVPEDMIKNALNVDDIDVGLGFQTYAYNDGKKTKMQKKVWGLKSRASKLADAESFFPFKKMTKMKETEKIRLTRRADAFAFLGREMKAISPYTNNDMLLIPIGDEMYVRCARSTSSRMGQITARYMSTWRFYDVKLKKSAYSYETVVDIYARIIGQTPHKNLAKENPDAIVDYASEEESVSLSINEILPEFSDIFKDVIELIKSGKYKDAGKLMSAKNKYFDDVIFPRIKAGELK